MYGAVTLDSLHVEWERHRNRAQIDELTMSNHAMASSIFSYMTTKQQIFPPNLPLDTV